jgi:hypothetical protein
MSKEAKDRLYDFISRMSQRTQEPLVGKIRFRVWLFQSEVNKNNKRPVSMMPVICPLAKW